MMSLLRVGHLVRRLSTKEGSKSLAQALSVLNPPRGWSLPVNFVALQSVSVRSIRAKCYAIQNDSDLSQGPCSGSTHSWGSATAMWRPNNADWRSEMSALDARRLTLGNELTELDRLAPW